MRDESCKDHLTSCGMFSLCIWRLNWKCFCRRHDLTQGLKNLQCKTLIFVGERSPFHAESVYMNAKMNRRSCALVEVGSVQLTHFTYLPSIGILTIGILTVCCPWQVQACGSLVTEEHPYAMITPIELFLRGFGYYRQLHFTSSSSNDSNPTSPSKINSCIAPELLSPESLGIKLKPIKTRVAIEVWCACGVQFHWMHVYGSIISFG